MTDTVTTSTGSTDGETAPVRNRFLEGNFAPVPDEITVTDLEVVGTLPPALEGRYLRTGPNPFDADPANHHWFVGDGMVHGIELGGGRARGYRNRWVRSPRLAEHLGEAPVPAPASGGLFPGSGNTNVIHHAGAIYAINELSLPYEITAELDTVRQWDFGGPLPAGMNAHPKFDPVTGELHVMGYSFVAPFCWYHVVDPQGQLVRSEAIEMGGPVMVHDMGLTQTWAVVLDLPVVFDLEAAMSGRSLPYAWDDGYTARVGLLPRAGSAAETVWIEVDPCYVFHPLNAYDDAQGRVVIDVVRHPHMFKARDDNDSLDGGRPRLERWTLDPVARTARTEVLDDRAQEFPRADERLATLPHRYGYAMGASLAELGGTEESTAVLKHDLVAGTTEVAELGAGRVGGEFVFVPESADAGEDEGWLLGLVYDGATDRSQLVVLDAHDFGADPVATVELPRRVPAGFHGNWIPDTALA